VTTKAGEVPQRDSAEQVIVASTLIIRDALFGNLTI
jgi:hypothetical protein